LLVQAADYMMETTLSEDEGTGSQEPPASQEGYGSQEEEGAGSEEEEEEASR